jgi:predicted enzyme related to lactoylglutathione lyase
MNLLINLDVDDLEKAVHFYSSVFGLRVGRSFGAFGVEMVGSSAPIAGGAQLEKPIATLEWGRLALMADPFGHGFCFVQFLGRGYDEIAE